MAYNGCRPDLKVIVPPSNEPPCQCMMCTILKDLTREEPTSLPCLRRIPTKYLVEKGIVSRKGYVGKSRCQNQQNSPIELPAELPAELRAEFPLELPAQVPFELPAGSATEKIAELPVDVPVELPVDPPALQKEEEQINGIPISVVLLLRQIYRETEVIASPDSSLVQDTNESPTTANDSPSNSSEEPPEPSIRFSIDNFIEEGKPQAWPHPESVLMVSDVGNVQHKPAIVSPSAAQLVVPRAVAIESTRYIAWSPCFEMSTPGSPYTSGYGDSPKPKYQAYRPAYAAFPPPEYQAYSPGYSASPQPKYQAYRPGL